MADMIRAAKVRPEIREYALGLVAHVREKDFAEEIATLFEFVRDHIRYVRDVNGVETLQTPEKTLEYRQGDCDDQVILLASLLEIVGNETRLVAVGPKPRTYVHVYLQVHTPEGWVSLDPIMPVPVGWGPPGMRAVMIEGV